MEDVHNSVEAHEQHVVSCDVLHVFEPRYHGQLGQNGDCFQPNREGPDEVDRVERFMDEDGHHEGSQVQQIVRESVF